MTTILATVDYYEPWYVQIIKAVVIFGFVLTVVPILALRRRARPWRASLLAGAGSGALGLVLIGLKALVH